MITFLLGFFGYYDEKIHNKIGTINIFYLPYLFGYELFLQRKFYKRLPSGIYVFTGSQGSGKTLSMVRLAFNLKDKYSIFTSNMNLPSAPLYRNIEEIFPLKKALVVCDELGIVANSKKSKDVNEQLLKVTAQNRKNQRLILTTAQQYYQVNKDIRTQATFIVECRKIFPVVLNFYYKPKIDQDGNVVTKVPFKIDFFIVTKKLYDLYDTSEVIL